MSWIIYDENDNVFSSSTSIEKIENVVFPKNTSRCHDDRYRIVWYDAESANTCTKDFYVTACRAIEEEPNVIYTFTLIISGATTSQCNDGEFEGFSGACSGDSITIVARDQFGSEENKATWIISGSNEYYVSKYGEIRNFRLMSNTTKEDQIYLVQYFNECGESAHTYYKVVYGEECMPCDELSGVNFGSSSTWGEFNVDACRTSKKGMYYMWGNTDAFDEESKAQVIIDNDIFYVPAQEGTESGYSTYNESDRLNTLLGNSDIASYKFSNAWEMPTLLHVKDLRDIISNTDISKEGDMIKISASGKELLFPTGGYLHDGNVEDSSSSYMWTSALNTEKTDEAYAFVISAITDTIYSTTFVSLPRYYALQVRPVLKETLSMTISITNTTDITIGIRNIILGLGNIYTNIPCNIVFNIEKEWSDTKSIVQTINVDNIYYGIEIMECKIILNDENKEEKTLTKVTETTFKIEDGTILTYRL